MVRERLRARHDARGRRLFELSGYTIHTVRIDHHPREEPRVSVPNVGTW